MAAPLSPTRMFTCAGCQAALPYDEKRAGQKCRCGKCGKVQTIPGKSTKAKPKQSKPFTFICILCETRLIASAEHAGKKMKCPDCGTLNKIPAPPKPRLKQVPKAMHGQQYGVWDADGAPLPEDIAAHQPKFFPVFCCVCDTLMHAHDKQIGQKLTCPDCGALTTVLEPKQEKEKSSVLVPDGEEYQLDESFVPEPRLVPKPVAVEDAEKRKEYRESLQEDYGDQGKMPALPLIVGVMPMLFRKPIPVWWFMMTMVWLAIYGLIYLLLNEHPFIGLCAFALACMIGTIAFGAVSSLCCAILTESSEGNRRLFNSPNIAPGEWLGEATYVGVSLVASLIPGAVLGKLITLIPANYLQDVIAFLPAALVENSPPMTPLCMVLGVFVCFPIFLLSALEQGSPMDVLSLKLLRSFRRRPLHWMFFFAVTGAVFLGTALGLDQLVSLSEFGFFAIFPVASAILLLYFRLLGRHAWWLAESLSEEYE